MTDQDNDKNKKGIRTNYVLIDYENVQPLSFNVAQGYQCKVILFIGANQPKIPVELASSMHTLGSDAEYIRLNKSGKNALDFHITCYLGQHIERDPNGYFHIISKDTGFDSLIEHLRDRKILTQRHKDLSDIQIFSNNFETMTSKIDLILIHLKKRGDAKPKKTEALINTINAIFLRTLTPNELNQLVKELTRRKHIAIKDTKITYHL